MAETSSATADWSDVSVEKKLIEILLEEKAEGNFSGGQVHRKRWKHVVDKFRDETGKKYNDSQIREKLKRLKKNYTDLRNLLEETTLKWDFVRKTVTGNEDAWTSALAMNSGWSRFRDKMLSNYELVGQLMSTSAQTVSVRGSTDNLHEQDGNTKGKRSAPTGPSTGEKKRKTVSFDMATENPIIIETEQNSDTSMRRVVAILDSMNISMDTRFKALQRLEKTETRESFFSFDSESRKPLVEFLASNWPSQ